MEGQAGKQQKAVQFLTKIERVRIRFVRFFGTLGVVVLTVQLIHEKADVTVGTIRSDAATAGLEFPQEGDIRSLPGNPHGTGPLRGDPGPDFAVLSPEQTAVRKEGAGLGFRSLPRV